MKKIMKYNCKNVLTSSTRFLVIGLLALNVLSCSKDKPSGATPEGETGPTEGTVLSFTVNNVTDPGISTVASTGNKSQSEKGFTEFIQAEEGGFDALMEIKPTAFSTTLNGADQATGSRATTGLKAGSLPTTAKYRILIYDEQNAVLKQDVEVQSGTTPKIPVSPGVKYNWYAVSTNESTAPTVANGVISKSDLSNKDVLYAKGTITPQANVDNKIPIDFKHLNVAYSINVDSRGAFSSINNATQLAFPGSNTTLYAGDLNLFEGTYSNETAIPANSLTSSMTTTINSSSTGRPVVKNAVFYSSKGQTFGSNTFSVKFNTLSLRYDEDGTTNTSNNRTFPFSKSFTSTPGNQYVINVNLLQTGNIINGNIVWSRTNLIYVPGNSGNERYRFRKDNAYNTQDPNEFWNWKSQTPTGNSGVVDPCSLVYPLNTWRMPTRSELNSLGTASQRVWQPSGSNGVFFWVTQGAYVAWQWRFGRSETLESEYNISNPKTLILPLLGYRSTSGSYLGAPADLGLGLFAKAAEGHYWSSTSGTYQHLNDGSVFVFLPTVSNESKTGSNNEGRNIRCVRTKI